MSIDLNRPYLQAGKREALADYSLPVAVITLSFVGSYLFQDVTVERFRYDDKNVFTVAPLERLSMLSVLGAMGLGFSLSLLFFMDQNITSAMVNNPCNKYYILNDCSTRVHTYLRICELHFASFVQVEEGTGLSLGSVCRCSRDGFPVCLWSAVDARHFTPFTTSRPRIG